MAWRRGWTVAGFVLLLGTLLGTAACGDDDTSAPETAKPEVTGQRLAEKYMTLLRTKDRADLEEFLSQAFIIQRADGSWATKEQYLDNLPEIREYLVRAVTARQDGPVLTVKWDLVVDETIDGRTFRGDPAPRLSTFLWRGDEWQLVSHANFNTPATATATPASGR